MTDGGKSKLRRDLRDAFSSESYLRSNYLRIAICLVAACIIACQHISYRSRDAALDRTRYRIRAATGLKDGIQHYSYGLYYWGLFPVYSTYEINYRVADKYSKEFARRLLMERGETLRMEYERQIRFGEYFKFYLTYLASLVAGRPGNHDLGVVNTFFFLGALFMVLLEFHRCNRTLLGALVALVVSSSEFQAIQLQSDNFSYIITAATFTLALMAPFIFDRRMRPVSMVARMLVAAFCIVLCGNVRSTAMSMFLGPPIALLFYNRHRLRWRMVLLLTYLMIFISVYEGFQAYFNFKIRQATEFVQAVGGVPYLGERLENHPFWHPIWCGLADFDTTHGHKWEDNRAWATARPEMLKRGWSQPRGGITQGQDYTMCTNPLYGEVMREIVLDDIRSDPRWYLSILGKRIKRTFTEWQTPRMDLILHKFYLPYSFWPYALGIVLFMVLGMWSEWKLVVLTLPTATLAIAITTYTNGHFYLIAHLVCAAAMLGCGANGIIAGGSWLLTRVRKKVHAPTDTGRQVPETPAASSSESLLALPSITAGPDDRPHGDTASEGARAEEVST